MIREAIKFLLMIIFVLFTGCGGDANRSVVSNPTNKKDNNQETKVSNRSNISVYFSKTNGGYSGGIDENIADDIDRAKSSIKIAIYDLTNDTIKDAILRAYDSGVSIQIVTDDATVDGDDFKELKNRGIKVYDDNKSYALMHDKFMIIDNKFVWSGSSNYTYWGFYRNNENDVRIENSSLAKVYSDEFNMIVSHSQSAHNYMDNSLEVYFSPKDKIENKIIALINNANKEIDFLIYAFTSSNIANALINAQNRGIIVKGVFDEDWNQNKYSKYDYLKKAGVNVLKDGNNFTLHDKVMIIDKSIVITGSYNYTISANKKNSENILIINNKNIANKYENEFNKIYEDGKN